GATSGTLSNPSGPLVNLADKVVNVDAVLGDHTDVQVIATRAKRGAGHREPEQRNPLHTCAPRSLSRYADRRLQDGRLPQPVEHWCNGRPRDPGPYRSVERTAGAGPRHRGRRVEG